MARLSLGGVCCRVVSERETLEEAVGLGVRWV